jgi:hypothetical protein
MVLVALATHFFITFLCESPSSRKTALSVIKKKEYYRDFIENVIQAEKIKVMFIQQRLV